MHTHDIMLAKMLCWEMGLQALEVALFDGMGRPSLLLVSASMLKRSIGCKQSKELCCNMFAACRGCGNTPLTSPKPLHIALSADVYEAVRNIREKYPDAPVFLVGFSIGAYTMTKYIGEADSGVWPEGAVPFLLNPSPLPHPTPCPAFV